MILITGGAGFIGANAVLNLLKRGESIVVLDNFSNSSYKKIQLIECLSGKKVEFIEGDVRDASLLKSLFSKYCFKSVIHFAALKSVPESCSKPGVYFDNNVAGTLNLLDVIVSSGCNSIVFSSSCTIYGGDAESPVKESVGLGAPTNPYGRSKIICEQMISDFCSAHRDLSAVSLRYFNPVGSDPSGFIGESFDKNAMNLFPQIARVLGGLQRELFIYGNDYCTLDGTGVRDFIHITDLIDGHIDAMNLMVGKPGYQAFNLGTGSGYTVKQIVNEFQKQTGILVPCKYMPRRPGDIATSYADVTLAEKELGWKSRYSLENMVESCWHNFLKQDINAIPKV